MKLKSIWSGNVGLKGVLLVALVSLVVGLGMSGSLDWLSPSRAVNMMGESGNPEPRSPGQLPDFVALAKKVRPSLVKSRRLRSAKDAAANKSLGIRLARMTPLMIFGSGSLVGPPRGPQRQRSLGSGFIIDADGSILTTTTWSRMPEDPGETLRRAEL